MHYIDVGSVHVVQASDLPPGAVTNPADGACQVCCDIVSGAPANWRCMPGTCTTNCTLKSQDLGGGQTLYYCGCS
jgi:hypothetical protein